MNYMDSENGSSCDGYDMSEAYESVTEDSGVESDREEVIEN